MEKDKENKEELKERSLEKKWKVREYNLPYILNMDNPTNKRIDEVLKRYLPKNLPKGFSFLEIGCTPGRWMIYFNKKFGYLVSGCDIQGLEKTKENLKLNNVKGYVFYKDIKNKDKKISKYDAVFSEGLIEHFKNPKEIFDNHIELSKEYIIILVPNLTTYKYDKETSMLITINDLKEWSKDLNMLFLGYIGGREPRTIHWDKHPFINRYVKPLLIRIWSCFKFKESNKSPYIMLIAKK